MAEVSFYSTLARAARDKDTCDVTYLVQAGPIKIDLVEKGRLRRHSDEVLARHIIGFVATYTEIDAAGPYQFLGNRHDFPFGQRRRFGG